LVGILAKYGEVTYEADGTTPKAVTTGEGYEIMLSDVWTGEIRIRKLGEPILTGGLTPIKWNGTAWVNIAETDPEWYDYIAQTGPTTSGGTSKWANAKTSNGSMLVWIPRYEYKILSGEHQSGAEINPAEPTLGAGVIDVNIIPVSQTTPTSGYTIHPAFTNTGNNGLGELEGIWVGKFESSNDGADNVKIVPDVTGWRNTNISTMFTKSQAFAGNNSLSGYDSHMMKNTEWGAVAYFAHSKYGRNGTEVMRNNSSGYFT
jgi:hypothetical protein